MGKGMTLKRLVLGALTILAIVFVIGDLVNSWSQPQFNSRLELYETDLQLQASEWKGDSPDSRPLLPVENPFKSALESYQKAQKAAQKDVAIAEEKLEKLQLEPSTNDAPPYKPTDQTEIAAQRIRTTSRRSASTARTGA